MTQLDTVARQAGQQDTKSRILDTAEALFVEGGFDSLSMRQITNSAGVNLAAVNYHFGGKDALIQAVLARRLDPLNEARITMLDKLEASLGEHIQCEQIMVALFLPAERIARSDAPYASTYIQFLGRAYTDPSPVVREYIDGHYLEVQGRFFLAFKRALPELALDDLAFRLHFSMGALASILAGGNIPQLQSEFTQGQADNQVLVLSRLITLMTAALKVPLPGPRDTTLFDSVVKLL